MYAVVVSGGKQYRVSAGAQLVVDRRPEEVGAEVALDQVLMVGGEQLLVGTPTVAGAKVRATVVSHDSGVKTEYTRYTHRQRRRTQKNGRAKLTVLQINGIEV